MDIDQKNNATYEIFIREAVDYLNKGSISDLSEMCRQAINANKQRCEAYFLLSIAAYVLEDLGRALELAQQGHELSPDCREGNDLLAHLLAHVGKPDESVFYAKLDAVGTSNPLLSGVQVAGLDDLAKALNETQEVSYRTDAMRAYYEERFDDAIQSFEKELRLRNGDGEFFWQFGNSLCAIGEVRRGIAALHGAVHMEPENGESYLCLGNAYQQIGDHTLARACHERALQLADDDLSIVSAVSFSRSAASAAWPELDSIVSAWRRENESPEQSGSGAKGKDKIEKETLRIGYIIDRAAECDALRLIEPVLWHHDRKTTEVYVFSTDVPGDLTAERLGSLVAYWANIRDSKDAIVSETIKAKEVDILIDMTLTAKGHRPGVLAAKPAPKIYRWVGAMQDAFSFLYDGTLPNTASSPTSCLTAAVTLDSKHMPVIDGKSPVQTLGTITFGATADLARITPEVAMVWGRILRQIPGSKLALGNVAIISDAVQSRFMELFSSAGVVDRITFEELGSSSEDGLIVSRLKYMVGMDVYLDPFPVPGLVELADALWAGVPVITMTAEGDTSIAASIVTAAGYPEWNASDPASYIDLAVSVAAEVSNTPDWRHSMHERVKKSALFQPEEWKTRHGELLAELAS